MLGIERHGQGTHTWPDGSTYEGGWQHNAMHGQGTYRWPNGQKYVGAWDGGKAAGGWLHAADGGKVWRRHDAAGRWVVAKEPQEPTTTSTKPPPDTVESLCTRSDACTRRYIDSLLTDGDAIGQAFACAREAQKLDPASPLPHIAMARAFLVQRKHREGLEQAERARELDPQSTEAPRLAATLRARLEAAKTPAAKPEPSPTTQARAPAPQPAEPEPSASAPVATPRRAMRDRMLAVLRDALALLERSSRTAVAIEASVAVLLLVMLVWLVRRRRRTRRAAVRKPERPAAQDAALEPAASQAEPEPAPEPDAAPAPEPETPPLAAPETPAREGAAEADRRAPRFCGACGQRVEPEARFCSQCGHRLV